MARCNRVESRLLAQLERVLHPETAPPHRCEPDCACSVCVRRAAAKRENERNELVERGRRWLQTPNAAFAVPAFVLRDMEAAGLTWDRDTRGEAKRRGK